MAPGISRARQQAVQPRPRNSDNEFFKQYAKDNVWPWFWIIPVILFVLWPLALWNNHGEVTGWGALSELVWLALLAWTFFAIRKARKDATGIRGAGRQETLGAKRERYARAGVVIDGVHFRDRPWEEKDESTLAGD